ncbi:putative O-methyltransferase [Aspergillus campestris IBT 28561]|uniref:O-methyltransferase n=1 Tax=Aspergillus campestris (strain IBT 28561) TaxID=1392248 RepID=A0A2I1CYN5_ASPC2|nr:putative O-methyltransferase [Aspergillus campestris IBT 28561]PKY02739.1 putative O-methyltransferase [Aspergillus campestris IBT 28561]
MSPPVSPSPIQAPQHVQDLLTQLHKQSADQEFAISQTKKVISSTVIGDLEDKSPSGNAKAEFDNMMRDKFIALDEDKCQFVYQLITAMGATNIVEAGTSFGVSTIYLALAVAQNKARTRKTGVVIATENESEKAKVARGYWAQCGEDVEGQIDLREGNILETLKVNMPQVDLLLLDIWAAISLPTLKTVLPHFRPGAVVLTDNTVSAAAGYADLLAYMRDPDNGFRNMTLPFSNGFEMSVYLPDLASEKHFQDS